MYHREPTAINQLVKKLIEQSPHRHKLEEASIIDAWYRIMPTIVKRRTEQIYVRQNKVFVKLNSAPLRQELQNTKHQILKMLQPYVIDYTIVDILFTV
ncbi:MAG: DciA family protein [Candidatus Amoebophilus sp.]|uniref:DUF721 domain-containing protein n=1 Tax=Amoebophilus asiaticus (strain 5a2) TaxID=452471 RepID=B3ES40_AMOA5|nr:DciA family protein [Candidatus Amoebophilus asiaticus]ACE06042.1 hypothetical protein Aasi_0645 [Candidatus Amoebophilus asiaticus 5a2]